MTGMRTEGFGRLTENFKKNTKSKKNFFLYKRCNSYEFFCVPLKNILYVHVPFLCFYCSHSLFYFCTALPHWDDKEFPFFLSLGWRTVFPHGFVLTRCNNLNGSITWWYPPPEPLFKLNQRQRYADQTPLFSNFLNQSEIFYSRKGNLFGSGNWWGVRSAHWIKKKKMLVNQVCF